MAQSGPSVDQVFFPFQFALAGRYSIDRELGRGGMGIVFLAARSTSGPAGGESSFFPPDRASQPSLRERFLREARLAAKLSHPNIIPIHAVEETGGFVFLCHGVRRWRDAGTPRSHARTLGQL